MNRPLPIVLNLVLLLAIGFLVLIAARDADDARHLRYLLAQDALVVHYRQRQIVIPYREIGAVTFFLEPPPLPRSLGSGLGRSRFGRFHLDGIGPVQVYAADSRRPLIVVRCTRTNYGLTPSDAERFYRDLLARLPKQDSRQQGVTSWQRE